MLQSLRRLSLLAACLSASASAQNSQPPAPQSPPPPVCTTAEHRQFDFWVGRWDVFRTGTDRLAGRNHIESLYGGCALRESWMPVVGTGGGSFSSWLPQPGIWRQTWVDSANGWVVFEGRFEDGAMVLTGRWPGVAGPGSNPLVRMRYTREEGGAVRQLGEMSTDDGQTWQPSFDLTYRRAQEAPGG